MAGLAGSVGAGRTGGRQSSRPSWRGLTLWPPKALLESVLRRKLARDVIYLQASNFFQKGYGFVFSVIAVRVLGLNGYGDFLSILSLYNTVNLLGSLGLGQFLVVPLAQSAAAGNREAVAEAAGYNLKLSAVIAAGVLAVSLAFGPRLGDLIIHRADLGSLMRIVALGAFLSVLYNVSTTALQAVRGMRDLALVENVDMVLAKMLPIAPLLLGWGLPGLLWATLGGQALSACFALTQYRRVAVGRHGFPGFGALLRAAWAVPLGRFFRFSFLAAADKNVAQFFGQTPVLFLSRWAGAEQVGLFGVAGKVFTLLAALQGAVSKVFSVRLSQELGQQGPAATRRLFWRSSLFWGVAFTAAAAVFVALVPVFRWIYGPDKLPSLTLVVLLGLLTAKQGFTVSLGAIYLIMNRVATNALAKLPLVAIWLPLGALMVQRWGAIGAAGYQLGAYVTGDVMYFAILVTPWFWRGKPDRDDE